MTTLQFEQPCRNSIFTGRPSNTRVVLNAPSPFGSLSRKRSSNLSTTDAHCQTVIATSQRLAKQGHIHRGLCRTSQNDGQCYPAGWYGLQLITVRGSPVSSLWPCQPLSLRTSSARAWASDSSRGSTGPTANSQMGSDATSDQPGEVMNTALRGSAHELVHAS